MFLGDLIQRTLGEVATIAPRRASRFEPAAEPVEQVTMDVTQDRPSPRPAALPFPVVAAEGEQPVERIETRVIERPVAPGVPQDDPNNVVIVKKTPAPVVMAAAPPLPAVSERPAERRELRPVAPAPPPSQPTHPVTREIERETVVHERVETRVESKTIERRLESLVREPGVERIERIQMQATPVASPAAPVAPTRRAVTPRPTVAVPDTRPIPQPKPTPMEITPLATPPVVHVTIGRVEIRATAPTPARQTPRSREPKLGLEDYLQRRERA